MAKQQLLSVLAVVLSCISRGTTAFQLPNNAAIAATRTSTATTSLGMAPRFDKDTQTWFATCEEEKPSAGYNPIGSLYRAGPVPFFQRLVNADTYEQAVLKYMAAEGCDRVEAQGNMDAFLENPQDWAYQKMEEKKNPNKMKKDYANANMAPQQIILSTAWACVVVVFAYDLVTGVADGRYGKAEGNDLFHGNLWTLPF